MNPRSRGGDLFQKTMCRASQLRLTSRLAILKRMVRSDRVCPNSSNKGAKVDFEEVFQELERWNDVLKDDPNILRGPRP